MSEPILMEVMVYDYYAGGINHIINACHLESVIDNNRGGCTIVMASGKEYVVNSLSSYSIKNMVNTAVSNYYNNVAERALFGRECT